MSQFIQLSDYDATIFRDILDTLVREDETLVEICEDRAIEEMRCYLSRRYDCNAIFNASGNARNQLILMMAIDIAVYHIFCIHNPQNCPTYDENDTNAPSNGSRPSRQNKYPSPAHQR